jgi:hypothetical protein
MTTCLNERKDNCWYKTSQNIAVASLNCGVTAVVEDFDLSQSGVISIEIDPLGGSKVTFEKQELAIFDPCYLCDSELIWNPDDYDDSAIKDGFIDIINQSAREAWELFILNSTNQIFADSEHRRDCVRNLKHDLKVIL